MKENNKYDSIVEINGNEELHFNDFSISFSEQIESEQNGKSSASSFTKVYLIKEKQGKQTKVLVRHGQIPPQPEDFSVGGQKFTLFSYQTPDKKNILGKGIYIQLHLSQ